MKATTVGVDLGQSRDPTAIVVTESHRPRAMDDPDDRSWPSVQHRIIHIERVQLGTPYPQIVTRVSEVADLAARHARPVIVMDATGVGRPVVDLFRKEASHHQLRAVTFTAGSAATQPDALTWRVPKRELIGALEVVMQTQRLKAVPDLALAADLADELHSYQFKMTDSGNDTYEAARGAHDDLVCGLALAVWWAEQNASGQGWSFMEAWRREGRRKALA